MQYILLKNIYTLKKGDLVEVEVDGGGLKIIKDGLFWIFPNDEELVRSTLEPVVKEESKVITVKTKIINEIKMDIPNNSIPEYANEIIIIVNKDEDGRLSINTLEGDTNFTFLNSRPEVVKAIGELLIKASEID